MKKKRTEGDAALPRTEGGAAEPAPGEVSTEPVAVTPPLPGKEEVPEKQKKNPPPPQAVVQPEPARVPLRVFLVCCGIKWDQMAGFKSYAKRLKLGPLSILEWRQALADFQKRPVG